MTWVVAVTMLVAAFCGLMRRLAAALVGMFLLVMFGIGNMLVRQPASLLHLTLHAFHLILIFNVTYAAFLRLAAVVF